MRKVGDNFLLVIGLTLLIGFTSSNGFGQSRPNQPPSEPVPEPVTLLLFGTGLAGVGFAVRRRLRKKNRNKTKE